MTYACSDVTVSLLLTWLDSTEAELKTSSRHHCNYWQFRLYHKSSRCWLSLHAEFISRLIWPHRCSRSWYDWHFPEVLYPDCDII